MAVDRNGSTVTVRDEEGKIALVSPKELITGDVQLFRRSEMEVRSGDLLKFTATDREQGQMANQRYTVESVSEEGNIRLKGENGRVTINPEKVRAQQHLDYGWAVTGYGAQGASSDYVIALEGTKDGRKALASRRACYISASRVKEHVQIYTDGKADWVKAVKTPERDIKTAHDALAPETQRKQAKAIWAMGQPVNKTAIGRAWVRHQGMQDASLTAKIIPATRRFPEPALALPVYDNNGRSAGLALVSLVASPEGRMTQGETRMVMTERARGAVLQRSQSGNTIVASDLTAALDAVRNNPKDGVVWQTGDEPPSAWLPQKQLDEALNGVVEDCVNAVGVDINTASPSLLQRVAGLNGTTAKNVVSYREENGAFTSRAQIKKVPKLGPKAFQQCAGFLRVPESRSVLDNTAVHPESYEAAKALLALSGHTLADVKEGKLSDLPARIKTYGEEKAAAEIGVGLPTLRDIMSELLKPGRDVRDELPKPILRTDVLEMKDLKPGMVLTGTVRNVIDFGVFVDIGVHQDGLVHISQVSNKFIRHPSEVVSVGDVVKVVVLEVDEKKKRISLSMKQAK